MPSSSPHTESIAWRRLFVSVLLALTAGSYCAQATTLVRLTLEQMSRVAGRIVEVRALESHSRWNAEHTRIYTYTTFAVLDSLKGEREERVVVKQFGGKVGHLVMHVHGEPLFRPGDETVLFLAEDGEEPDAARIVGLAQGNFRLERDPATGEKFVVNALEGASYFDPRTRTFAQPVERLRLEEFKQKVLRMVARESAESQKPPPQREE